MCPLFRIVFVHCTNSLPTFLRVLRVSPTLHPVFSAAPMFCVDCVQLFSASNLANWQPSDSYGIVEYTPQAYLPGDLDMFFRNFSPSQVGQRPIFDSIDGGLLQTQVESFNYNGESVSLSCSTL
jgi:hypothetical protein